MGSADVYVYNQGFGAQASSSYSSIKIHNKREVKAYVKDIGDKLMDANKIAGEYIRKGWLTPTGKITNVPDNPLRRRY